MNPLVNGADGAGRCWRRQIVLVSLVASAVLATPAPPAAGRRVQCGRPTTQPELIDLNVIGGRDAVPGSWPWHVGLYTNSSLSALLHADYYAEPTCGGALIDSRTVLTAAHCLGRVAARTGVRLGSHRYDERDAGELDVDVDHFCVHPNYTLGNVDDIGIVRLARSVEFSDTVAPICLPAADDEVDPDDDQLYITGWGYTSAGWNRESAEVLQQARQMYIDKNECRRMRLANVRRVICTRHDYGSSCHGDSGGPLVLERDGRWQLQGVVSGGPPVCAYADWPMYYTEVAKYRNWIDRYLAAEQPLRVRGLCKRNAPAPQRN